MRLEKQIIYVTGLPRAGSALMCQLLGHHPQIYSTHHSSPLCQTLDNLSDNQFLLAWFDTTDQQLLNTHREDTNNEPIAYKAIGFWSIPPVQSVSELPKNMTVTVTSKSKVASICASSKEKKCAH